MVNLMRIWKESERERKWEAEENLKKEVETKVSSAFMKDVLSDNNIKLIRENIVNQLDQYNQQVKEKNEIVKDKYEKADGRIDWEAFYSFAKDYPNLIGKTRLNMIFNSKQVYKDSAFDILKSQYQKKIDNMPYVSLFYKQHTRKYDRLTDIVSKMDLYKASYKRNVKDYDTKINNLKQKLSSNIMKFQYNIQEKLFKNLDSVKQFNKDSFNMLDKLNQDEIMEIPKSYQEFIELNVPKELAEYDTVLLKPENIALYFKDELEQLSKNDKTAMLKLNNISSESELDEINNEI